MITETKTYSYEDFNTTIEKMNPDAALPALAGSEKQINWARTIRLSAGKEFFCWFDDVLVSLKGQMTEDEISAAAAPVVAGWNKVMTQTSAAWWIDNRHTNGPNLPALLA